MKKRKLGLRGPEVSPLGFGCMRLPVISDRIDRPAASAMLLEAIDAGTNYIDTAFLYHDGESETFIADTITGSRRDKVIIADKMPSWLIENSSDLDKYFNIQRRKLKSERIEVYLIHGLNSSRWKKIDETGVLDWFSRKKESGEISYTGFSFHDDYQSFENIIESWNWDVCQIQYNFMNVEYQAGVRGLKKAYEQGIGVIVMEPLFGGKLVHAPRAVKDVWMRSGHPEWTPAERALRWLWDQKEVGMVLSGMSSMEQVKENIKIASDADFEAFTTKEKLLFDDAREAYQSLKAISCTACDYCKPCPHGVDIPWNFELYNRAVMYENLEASRKSYQWMCTSYKIGVSETDKRAIHCVSCGECLPRCPQNLDIAKLMPEVAAVLAGERELMG